MSTPKVLIIPDVHGRTFWKDAIDKYPITEYPNLQIVFLGDYLDPYESYDGISKEDAFVNFEDIIYYSETDPRITLLIGNHDWHYFVNLDQCRIDKAREKNIEHIFKKYMSRFRLTYTIELDNCKYLFSHAGITSKWLKDVEDMAKSEIERWNPGEPSSTNYIDPLVDEEYKWLEKISHITETKDFELFETCLKKYDEPFYSAPISMISRERGGYYPHGSLIWADVYEHFYSEDLKGYYQIFGHTISFPHGSPQDYSISPDGHSWAMIDASKAFILDVEGNIEPVC